MVLSFGFKTGLLQEMQETFNPPPPRKKKKKQIEKECEKSVD